MRDDARQRVRHAAKAMGAQDARRTGARDARHRARHAAKAVGARCTENRAHAMHDTVGGMRLKRRTRKMHGEPARGDARHRARLAAKATDTQDARRTGRAFMHDNGCGDKQSAGRGAPGAAAAPD